MKHTHYDMGVAKLANILLVKFVKLSNEWVATTTDEWNVTSDYFLCLPQHKEACLHWLNGGRLLVRYHLEDEREFLGVVHLNTLKSLMSKFTDSSIEFRIKPKKEKRWIGVFPSVPTDKGVRNLTSAHYESLEDLMRCVHAPNGFDHWQFIEIEVEI